MSKRELLFTFDHELFLGKKTGTFEKCMIEPTTAIQSLLNEFGIKGVFFVDTTCLLTYLGNSNDKKSLGKVFDQIKTLFNDGHYIFPHLHPHWLDARLEKETAQYSLNETKNYSLAALSPDKVERLFRDSLDLLRSYGIDHFTWGYRAGGWCIQPFSRYRNTFTENGIAYEFSVLPGYQNENPEMSFDFTNASAGGPYRFSENVEQADDQGVFSEFPISTIKISNAGRAASRLLRKIYWKLGHRGWGDGYSAQTYGLKGPTDREMISMDLIDAAKLPSYKHYLRDHHYMHWISHPKMLTQYSLTATRKFLKYASNNFDLESDFKNFTVGTA